MKEYTKEQIQEIKKKLTPKDIKLLKDFQRDSISIKEDIDRLDKKLYKKNSN